jgi:hypothetical protein
MTHDTEDEELQILRALADAGMVHLAGTFTWFDYNQVQFDRFNLRAGWLAQHPALLLPVMPSNLINIIGYSLGW